MKKFSKGFTLIELLVVIAIIGILSGIVLTSLGSARTKAKNSSAIASLSAMRAEAELSITNAGVYPSTICSAGSAGSVGEPLTKLAAAITAQGITDLTCSVDNVSTVSKWAVGSPTLKFCVDSGGYAGTATTATNQGAHSGGACTTS